MKGPPGSGKTYLAGAITQLCRTKIIDVEGGIVSAYPVVNPSNLSLSIIREPDPDAFFARLGEAMGEAVGGGFEAVVLDSFSEVVGRMEDQYSRKSVTGKLEYGDWFVLLERAKRFARTLRDLQCHTIVTSLTKPTKQEGGDSIFEPVIPGNAAAAVPSFFDTVGLMRRGMAKSALDYFLVTDGPAVYQVRDRTHVLAAEERVDPKSTHMVWSKMIAGIKNLAVAAGVQPQQPAMQKA